MVRIEPALLARLDAWIDAQEATKPSRPEAIRRIIERALAKSDG
jgi:metal-responsive CopG/Arc/MetJ family transcriptional regulator